MDVSHVLDSLNEGQRDAVAAPLGNLLVLAGAGSGKTRVLVHRIAWHIATGEANPQGILAVTFTNKAASEMRSRIETLLGQSIHGCGLGHFTAFVIDYSVHTGKMLICQRIFKY